MTVSFRIRLARWLLRGTGYHLRAGRKPKVGMIGDMSSAELVRLVRDHSAVRPVASKP